MENQGLTQKRIKSLVIFLIYVLIVGSGLLILLMLFSKKARKNPKHYLKRVATVAGLIVTVPLVYVVLIFRGFERNQ